MKIQKEYWFVMISGVMSGFIVFMGQVFSNLGLSVYEICTLAYIITTTILLPFILFNPAHRYKKKMFWLNIAYVLVSITIIFSQYSAVMIGTPVAIVVLLLYTQPLWTTLISKLFLKEKVTKVNIIACILVLLGILLLANPFTSFAKISSAGLIVSLIGGLGLSGWIVLGSVLSKKGNSPINSLFSTMAGTVLFAVLTQPLAARIIHDPRITNLSLNHSTKAWLVIIAFAFTAQLANHLFYLNGVKKVRAIDADIIMLLEPIVGAILAAIFLHQRITLGIILGGALILLANYLVIKSTQNSHADRI